MNGPGGGHRGRRRGSDEPPRDKQRILLSWLWALSPLWSIGILTAPAMVWAAWHKRSVPQGMLAAIYVVCLVLGIDYFGSPIGSDHYAAYMTSWSVLGFVGLGHGLLIREWAFDLDPPSDELTASDLLARQKTILAISREEAAARKIARGIAETDPAEAFRLQIGRIDIPKRRFPDGGLVDVNNVPAEALAKALLIPEQTADTIVVARDSAGGFTSIDEMSVLAALPPNLLAANADQIVFLPARTPSS